ncbi:uncharacterized protein [Aegilops tauschii subsp. strangulata]|uniref:uncharacterized protein n=1 Tax=Aegilops tauschii subsp. strangulata TaxID=200361 RepID=UPI003CC83CAB
MTAKAAEALIHRFDEPLSDSDIKAIAKLTNLDVAALKTANVRGLNSLARRAVVSETAELHRLALLCLQETKIEECSLPLAREVGGAKLTDCVVLPAMGTMGAPAIFWDKNHVVVHWHVVGQFSAKVTLETTTATFWLTMVYGLVDEGRKGEFLAEIARTAPQTGDPRLINGDFNLIYEAKDKNNSNINRRIMGKF